MIGIKNQSFGMELEFTGLTRKKAATIIGAVVNRRSECQYKGGIYDAYTVMNGYRKFYFPIDILVHAVAESSLKAQFNREV